MKITKDTTLSKIIGTPGAEKVLAKHGVPCVTCPYAKMEMEKLQIGDICKTYGINAFTLLKDLNSIGKSKKKKRA